MPKANHHEAFAYSTDIMSGLAASLALIQLHTYFSLYVLLPIDIVQTTVGVFVSSSLDYWTLLQHARMRELSQAAWSYPNLNCLWHIRRLALAWLAGPRPMLVTKSLVWIQQPAMLRIFRAWLGGRDLVLKCFVWIFFFQTTCALILSSNVG